MINQDISIRAAKEEDFHELYALWDFLDRLHRIGRPDLFRKPEQPGRDLETIRSLIAKSDNALLVAEQRNSDELLGLAHLYIRTVPELPVRKEYQVVEIDSIVVRPNSQRRGVGGRLVEASIAWAKQQGLESVELSAHSFNTDAIAFYHAMGFKTVVERMNWKRNYVPDQ